MRFHVWLQLDSPLVISRNRATGNQLRTLSHVPGTAWRGAAAAALMREKRLGEDAHKDAEFHALFLEGKVRFGDLRAGGEAPFPLSTRCCSLHDHHRYRDLLLYSALGEAVPQTCGAWTGGDTCCEARLIPGEGFIRWEKGQPTGLKPDTRVTAHTAISNDALRIRTGQFYSSTVLEAGQTLRGELWAEDGGAEVVAKQFQDPLRLVLGRGGSRGQGRATVTMQAIPQADERRQVRERLEALNALFAPGGRVAFTVTLRSPCLVYDRWLCARPFLTAEDIGEAAGEPTGSLAGYALINWFSRFITVSGWNAQARLPKPDVRAIAPGSAFVFCREVTAESKGAELDRLEDVLSRARRGIGERWEEGFGEASFCDEIHYALRSS